MEQTKDQFSIKIFFDKNDTLVSEAHTDCHNRQRGARIILELEQTLNLLKDSYWKTSLSIDVDRRKI